MRQLTHEPFLPSVETSLLELGREETTDPRESALPLELSDITLEELGFRTRSFSVLKWTLLLLVPR